MKSNARLRAFSWLLGICIGFPGLALAQAFPSQPIRMIVPYPPGGSTDLIARQYADGLTKVLGQTIVVDNRPGASTNIGSDAVAKAKPDGYTVLFGGAGTTLNMVFGPKPPFDPVNALEPISLVARVPFMVAANPRAPFSNPRELVAAAGKSPGKLTVSSAQLNVYVELMKSQARLDILHVPYKGGAQATTDAVAGQVDMVYALVPVLLPQVQAGKLKAIGISSRKRLDKALPQVPTFAESGIDHETGTWYGLMAPAGTPAPVLDKLLSATRAVVTDPQFVARLAAIGAEAEASDPDALRKQMAQEQKTWEKLLAQVPSLLVDEQK